MESIYELLCKYRNLIIKMQKRRLFTKYSSLLAPRLETNPQLALGVQAKCPNYMQNAPFYSFLCVLCSIFHPFCIIFCVLKGVFYAFSRFKNRNITKTLPIFAKNRISAAYRNPSIYKGKIGICIFECSKFLPKFLVVFSLFRIVV